MIDVSGKIVRSDRAGPGKDASAMLLSDSPVMWSVTFSVLFARPARHKAYGGLVSSRLYLSLCCYAAAICEQVYDTGTQLWRWPDEARRLGNRRKEGGEILSVLGIKS
jgi:hypothetical protein